MAAFREFELEAIRLLAAHSLSREQLAAVASTAALASYEHTGCGYFAKVVDPILPMEPSTLSAPFVAGHLGETMCGFVVFLGGGELTLECHPVCGPDAPENIRDLAVQITIEPSNVVDLR